MVRTRNQGASPGGFQTLESPFFKRTRKLPKKKQNPEADANAQLVGESAASIHLQSIVTYTAPDTTSPSVSPQPEESRSESPHEAESRSTSPPFILPPSNAGAISSRRRPNSQDVNTKKQPRGRPPKNTQGPSTHQGANPSGTRRKTRRPGASHQETSDADAEDDDQPVKTLRNSKTPTHTPPKSLLGKRARFPPTASNESGEDEHPVKRTRPTMQPTPVFDSPLKTLIKSFTPVSNTNTTQISNTPVTTYQTLVPYGTKTSQEHGYLSSQNTSSEQLLTRVNETSSPQRALPSTTSESTKSESARRSTSNNQIATKMYFSRRASTDGLDVEATVAQRLNEPKCQMTRPKMILPGHPAYDEELESDDDMMAEAADRVKYQSRELKLASRYLEDEKKKEIECKKAGKSYTIPTPIRNITRKNLGNEASSRKSMANQISKSSQIPRVPFVRFSAAPGHEEIILTDQKIVDTLRAVAEYSTRNPAKTLPDSEEIVAYLGAPESFGQAAIMPANHTVEQTSNTDTAASNAAEVLTGDVSPSIATSKQNESAKRRFMTPNIRRRMSFSTYSQPADSLSESDENMESDVNTKILSDKEQAMSESESEVAPLITPRASKTPEKTPASQGWGLFSAVKNIVASPVKFFAGTQQAAVAAPTNNQKLDLNYQSLKPGRVIDRGATPKSATARRIQKTLKFKGSQSERKASSQKKPFIPMHERGAAEVESALAKAKREFRKQQERMKAKRRKEAEENPELRHIDNFEGTFKVPDSDSDDTEEELSQSPLARKVLHPKKTVTWSSDVLERPSFLKHPGSFSNIEEELEWHKYNSEMAPNLNLFSRADKNNGLFAPSSPGLWTLQTQWWAEGKSVEECAILEAEFLKKESANKAAWEKQLAARRAEERERKMALERKKDKESEKMDKARTFITTGKTKSVGGGSEWNRDPSSMNETHNSNETNSDNPSLGATSTPSYMDSFSTKKTTRGNSSMNETRDWTGTNPGKSSVNEISTNDDINPDYNNPNYVTIVERYGNTGGQPLSARQRAHQISLDMRYYAGMPSDKSPFVLQKLNPWGEQLTTQEEVDDWIAKAPERKEAKEAARKAQELAEKKEFQEWKMKEVFRKADEAKKTREAKKAPLGERRNLQAPGSLEHPSVSAAKANAYKYSPKKPSHLRNVHTISPVHSARSNDENEEPEEFTVERLICAGDRLLQPWIAMMDKVTPEAFPSYDIVNPLGQKTADDEEAITTLGKTTTAMRKLSIDDSY